MASERKCLQMRCFPRRDVGAAAAAQSAQHNRAATNTHTHTQSDSMHELGRLWLRLGRSALGVGCLIHSPDSMQCAPCAVSAQGLHTQPVNRAARPCGTCAPRRPGAVPCAPNRPWTVGQRAKLNASTGAHRHLLPRARTRARASKNRCDMFGKEKRTPSSALCWPRCGAGIMNVHATINSRARASKS